MRRTLFILFAICALALPACDDLKTEESRKVLLGIATQVRQLDAETTKLQKQLKDSDVEQLKKINAKIDSKAKLREQLVQSAATTVKIPDGGSLLLGGLKSVLSEDRKSGNPIVDHIPVLSFFFSKKGRAEELDNLLILVRGQITDMAEAERRIMGGY